MPTLSRYLDAGLSASTVLPATPAKVAAQTNGAVEIAVVTSLDALQGLGGEWMALFEASGLPHQVFQTFEWASVWASLYLGPRTRLSVVTARVEGRLVLVWPLVIQRTGGLRVLSGMGEPLSQYSDAIMACDLDPSVADAAFDAVMRLPADVLALRRVRDDAALAALLRRRLGPPVNLQASPYVDLAGLKDAAAFEARFPGKLRSDRRRRRRRLDERGPVSITHGAMVSDAAAQVATGLAFKRDWARLHGIIAPAINDPRFERFFVKVAEGGCDMPDLRLSVMDCAGEVVGVALSVACKGHLFGHVLAPRPDLDHLGLGGILAEQTIVGALEQGFQSMDLLAPADSYKLDWTSDVVGVGDYLASRSLRGAMYTRLWLRFGRSAVKRVAARARPLLKRLSRNPRAAP